MKSNEYHSIKDENQSYWPHPRYLYPIGFIFSALALCSAVMPAILNVAWEDDPYSISNPVLFVGLGCAFFYCLAFAKHAAHGKHDESTLGYNIVYLLCSIVILSASVSLLDEGDLIGKSAQPPDNSTEKVFASLYGMLGASSLMATTTYLCNMVNPKI